jgi:hypothetical protein
MALLAPSQLDCRVVVETLGGSSEPDGRRDPMLGGRLFISVKFPLTAGY